VVAACPAARPGTVSCAALVRTWGTAILRTGAPTGYGPAQLRTAYSVTGTAAGHPLVALAEAFGDSHALSDLTTYRARYGLAPMTACAAAGPASGPCFEQVTAKGSSTGLPPNNLGWDQEQSLDLDMVSAACPSCSIVVVETPSTTDGALAGAVDEAVSLGAVVVSNSYNGPEDAAWAPDYAHAGVAVVASSGDDGYQSIPQSPADYPSVVATGGSTLTSVTPRVESAWSGAGSYCAAHFAKPAWQVGVAKPCRTRAVSDLAVDANPGTGVAVYDTGWEVLGGTSVASPFVAGLIADAGNWASFGTTGAAYLYAHAAGLHDITGGSNGSCAGALCHAGPGWDGPTGLGSPDGLGAL
jgi:subtilase family serine protease